MNYAKLRGRIREIYGTNRKFAIAMGMNCASLSFKLNNRTQWTRDEIGRACSLLGIAVEDVWLYFFSE